MAELSTLARPYAKGVFAVARTDGQLDAWSQQLALLAALASEPQVAALLANPRLTADQQVTVLTQLCGAEALLDSAGNFLTVLAENRRLRLLPQIFEQFQLLKAAQDKTVEVEVVSAFPLDAAMEQTLSDKLSKRLDRKVHLSTRVDDSLLGGVLIKAGDLVIDGSVRGRLNKLAEAMNL
jgi:F-type H+-transporting ATPase subunit delta